METQNEAIRIAKRFNLWIKYINNWYTPDQFKQKFDGVVFDEVKKKWIEFYYPNQEYLAGRQVLFQMIRDKKDPEEIINGLFKMDVFKDRMHKEYKPTPWSADDSQMMSVVHEYHESKLHDGIVNNDE